MSKIASGVSAVPQPWPKKPKLDGENPCADSLPTGKSQHTTPISPPTITENSSDTHPLDNPDPLGIDIFRTFGHLVPHAVPEDPRSKKQLHECFNFAVNEYNRLMKSNSELVKPKIVEAIRTYLGLNIQFCITFEADDTVTKQHVTYQTEIVCGPNCKTIHVIKEEGQYKAFLYPVDLDDQNENDSVNKCVVDAIVEFCDDQPRLEFVKIVKAVRDIMGHIYRISFEARNQESGQIGTYYIEAMTGSCDGLVAERLMSKDEMKEEHFFSLKDVIRRDWPELEYGVKADIVSWS